MATSAARVDPAVAPTRREGAARPRRVLMISYLFPPSIQMGAHACAQIARALPSYGWMPVVLTVRERHIEHLDARAEPAFPGTVVRTRVMAHPFTLYRRLKAWFGCGIGGGANGESSPPGRVPGLRHWLLSLVHAPDSFTGWVLPAVISGLAAVRKHGVEHLFSSGPPWT